jgi:uncharacterized protein
VADCERVLRDHGFRVCRVRYYETTARIEVDTDELPRLFTADVRADVVSRFRAAGFSEVVVDPRGYRSGALNAATPVQLLRRGDDAVTVPAAVEAIPL